MTDDKQHAALVTGASRGIGRAIAQQLAAAGHRVVGTATTQAGADAIAGDSAGIQAAVVQLGSESQSEQLQALVKESGPFDILVNNAGITEDDLALRMDEERWNKVINTNLGGAFFTAKACMRGMMKARWGRIVNISSVVGSSGNAGQVNYIASKAGLEGMTRALANELGSRGITVNAVAPGFVETDMTAGLNEDQRELMLKRVLLKRFATPEEIAGAVVFLCSDEAGYITGQTLHVNGGMYM